MTPARLLLLGLAVVTAVAALQEYSRSTQLAQRERLSKTLKNAALTAFIFGSITMLGVAIVVPTVRLVAGVLGYERRQELDARKHRARGFTQGEAYVVVALPLLFYAWAWARKDEPMAFRAPKPPAMSRGQAMELWFWCWAAAAERERRIDPGYPTPVVAWRVSACLRIQAAFERLHEDRSCRAKAFSDPLESRLARGLDPVGVVLFNRYLVQQRRFWEERASAGSEEEREEAEIRGSVVDAASRVFLRVVGATSAAIEQGAASLPLATDPRRLQPGLRMGGVVIYDEATEGPIPPEEEEPRWAEAIRRVIAAGEGPKS